MKRKQPFTYPEFLEIYSKVPRLCVDLIIKRGSEVLLLKREAEPLVGYWHVPGGTVFLGESIQDAVMRMAQEELDITSPLPKPKKMIGYMEFLDEIRQKKRFHSVSIAFDYSEISKLVTETENMKFFQALPEKIIPEHKKFLEENI